MRTSSPETRWARIRALALALAALALAACVDTGGGRATGAVDAPPSVDATAMPGDETLAHDQYGELVRQGWRIFTDTPHQARRFSGNALSCTNCHLDAGRRPNAAPMGAAWGMYPAYLAKVERVATIEERVQQCFRFSMNGVPPPLDSQEMRSLITYFHWLARGSTVGVSQPGRGYPTVPRTGLDPDPMRGKAVYAQRCAACHGPHGDGRPGGTGERQFPPLWGYDSFNKGAGLNRLDLMAGFLKANMPYGNPDLADQEALDVAAWIGLQERWPDPRKGLISGWLDH
jgi:thiosulfate dehydrogenase